MFTPLESKSIHDHFRKKILTVTRDQSIFSDNVNDQKRVTTPAMAKELTSSYIVVGRTIASQILWRHIKKFIKIFKE